MSRHWVHGVLAVLAWVAACWARAGTATRSFSPGDYGLSETVTVTVQFAPLADEAFNTLEETVPIGWTLVSDGGGAWDAGTRRLRWLATGGLARTFSFVVGAPASGEATAVFSGSAAFDGSVVTVEGAATLPRRAPGTAIRSFGGGATTYRPGVGVTVGVVVTPSNGTAAYGVEETLPAGWTASAVSDGGTFSGGKVTWPLFVDGLARTLGYTATAPSEATGAAAFGGVATFDGRTATTGGGGSLARAVDVAGSVTRSMPGTFHTGEALAVTLVATPGAAVLGYSVVEDLPEGWLARRASVSGTISQGGRRVTWGPFLDATARVLGYEAVPDGGTRGTGVFAGQGDFGGTTAATSGVTSTSWASLEDGTVTRGLPGTCRVGVGFEVTLTAAPNEHVTLYTVREVVPEGYAVRIPAGTVGSPAGTYSEGTRTITWGPISHEGSPVTLRYELTAGTGAGSSGVFGGRAAFGDVERLTGGPTGVVVLPALMGTATRTLPGMVEPGTTATVRVVATPDAGIGLWGVDEVLPLGWTAGTLPAGASYDAGLRRIRFGPFNDDASRALEYTATAGNGVSGPQAFAGTATFDGTGFAVGGATTVVANGRPTLSAMLDQTVEEDGMAVLSFLAADDLTASGSLAVTASRSNPGLVPGGGLVLGMGSGGVRTLTMGLATNGHGSSTITVGVSDGTYTTTRSFVLTVVPVNDAPSFEKGADVVAWDNGGRVTVAGWATGISAGPGYESGQGLEFLVNTTNGGLFAAAPAVASNGTLTFTPAEGPGGIATVTVRLRDTGGVADGGVDTSAAQTFTVTVQPRTRVVGRFLYYNGSSLDAMNGMANAADDGAVALDKAALRAGEKATFANVSSYARGINGVMVDVLGLAGTPTASSLGIRVGTSTNVGSWGAGPAPTSVVVRRGAGVMGSDRVSVTWADYAIRNQWMEVRVLADGATGLGSPDVFYFASVVGEVGDQPTTEFVVNAADVTRVRLAVGVDGAGVTSAHDMDRDGGVNSTDVITVRLNLTVSLPLAVPVLDLRGIR